MRCKKLVKGYSIGLIIVVFLASCNYSSHTPPATPTNSGGTQGSPGMEDGQNCDDMNTNPDLVVFEEVNQAVFQSNCVGCHSGQFPAAGVDLSSFDGAKAAASRVEFQVVNGMMPPPSRPSLSQNQKDLVAAWVQDGAVDEIGAVLCDEMMKE